MTSCSCCGDCCERIRLARPGADKDLAAWGHPDLPDPNRDPEWWTVKHGYVLKEALRGWANCRADAVFIRDHWTVIATDPEGEPLHACDAFDAETRLCTAHDERPPICRGFPWYGKEPDAAIIVPFKRCSFWADVPVHLRPVDVGGA